MLRSILRRSKSATSTENASAQVLNEIVKSCPQCGQPLHGHEYRLIATDTLKPGQMERFRELLSAIGNHDWRKVVTYQGWEGNQPNAEAYGLKCPGEALSVVVVSAPFALEEPYTLMRQERVENPVMLEPYLPDSDSWHPF